MGRCYYAKIIVLFIGVLMVHSAPGIAASDDAYQSVFIEHLEMGPATYLNIDAHGKTAADIDKRLTELYHGNRLQPFWIKRFQKRHNLTPDGAVGKQTLAAMNVPVASRIEQIVLNMERCR